MAIYEVHVHTIYKAEAKSPQEAYRKIDSGAEFPVLPYEENTHFLGSVILDVKEMKKEEL
jgi:hypothetical protein